MGFDSWIVAVFDRDRSCRRGGDFPVPSPPSPRPVSPVTSSSRLPLLRAQLSLSLSLSLSPPSLVSLSRALGSLSLTSLSHLPLSQPPHYRARSVGVRSFPCKLRTEPISPSPPSLVSLSRDCRARAVDPPPSSPWTKLPLQASNGTHFSVTSLSRLPLPPLLSPRCRPTTVVSLDEASPASFHLPLPRALVSCERNPLPALLTPSALSLSALLCRH